MYNNTDLMVLLLHMIQLLLSDNQQNTNSSTYSTHCFYCRLYTDGSTNI